MIQIKTIADYCEKIKLPQQHKYVAVVDFADIPPHRNEIAEYDLYTVFLKEGVCGNIIYGRKTYDYDKGTIVTIAPGQAYGFEDDGQEHSGGCGLGLVFHPDLLSGTQLAKEIKQYTYFSYAVNEALHISDDEKGIVRDCILRIKDEMLRSEDSHSRRLITSQIGLLLDYCMRFYDRQFNSREKLNSDIIARFENQLHDYFDNDLGAKNGIPTVKYFADLEHLSPNYFGDIIKRESGQTPQEYIKKHLIEASKSKLNSPRYSVSEVAYNLGFQYPQHFTRLFKKETGVTPVEFRKKN